MEKKEYRKREISIGLTVLICAIQRVEVETHLESTSCQEYKGRRRRIDNDPFTVLCFHLQTLYMHLVKYGGEAHVCMASKAFISSRLLRFVVFY